MVLCEDGECGVCFEPYSRQERIPRVLHCRHTFCATCLETMSQPKSGMLTVVCPLCRQMTCVGRGRTLHEALWVNSRLWNQITESTEEEEDEEVKDEVVERTDTNDQTQHSSQAVCPSSKNPRSKLKLPSFLRKFNLTRQPIERIVPSSNVEIKSWRRLSTEETS